MLKLKGRINNKIPAAVGVSILLVAVLGSSFLALRTMGLLGGDRTRNPLTLTQREPKSKVLPLVSLPPQQRVTQLEAIASGEKSRDRDRARYLLACDLIAQQQGEAALKWLDGLEANYPELAAHIALKRAQAYEVMGDEASARTAWQSILTDYPDRAVAAEALYVLGQDNPQYWEQAIAQFPNHPRTEAIARQQLNENPNQLSLLLLLAHHFPEAEGMGGIRDRLVDRFAAQLTPEDWQAIGFGYWETREYRKAGQAYAKAPRTPRNAYRTARGLQLGEKRAEARAAYQQLVRDFPEARETGLGLRRLASLSPSQEAMAYLDRAIEQFPDEAAEALLSKAQILEALGSGTSAAQARQSVLTQYASSEVAAEYRWNKAQQKAAQGNYEEAWQWAQPILTNNPDSSLAPEAGFWIGRWAAQLQRQDEARDAFKYVLANNPESYYAWRSAHYLGWNVGDFNTVRSLNPEVVKPQARPVPPTGSATFKELYQLGQDRESWMLWQVEFQNKQEPTVAEQFTNGLIHLGIGENLKGINQVWNLSLRETPEERSQWQQLRQEPAYWHALFPFPFLDYIVNWSYQRQLNPLLVTALIRQESRFEPQIRSVAGATGLMQVMPGTGSWIAEKIQLQQYNLEDPNDNVKLGTWYLDYTHQEYNNNSLLAVASYNAGPGNVAKWVTKYGFSDPDAFIETIPFPETKGYVETVFANYWNYLRLYNPEISQLLSQFSPDDPVVKRP